MTADPREIARNLGPAGARALVRLARAAAAAAVEGRSLSPAAGNAAPGTPVYGAFVTLTDAGRLRGCIGTLGRTMPASEAVSSAAAQAATADPRFPPVRPEELPRLGLEVSLLTPLAPVDPGTLPGAIVTGRDGLVVEEGPFRGLLLPQVATEHGLDAEAFLDATCRKAGLPPGCWRRGARVYRFSALVLPEDRPEEAIARELSASP